MTRTWPRFATGISSDPLSHEMPRFAHPDDATASKVLDQWAFERQLRYEYFQPDVVNDPSWAILQEIYRASVQERRMPASQLAEVVALPETTVLRYLQHLVAAKLLEDQTHRPESCPDLTANARHKLKDYVASVIVRRCVGIPI